MKTSLAIVLAVMTLGTITSADAETPNLALFGMAHGIDSRVASLTVLSQIRASQEPAGDLNAPAAEKATDISLRAFTDLSASLQIDMAVGERDSSASVRWLAIERE